MLNLQNCVIRNFKFDGLTLLPQSSSVFNIQDTIISNIGDNAIVLQPEALGSYTATIARVSAFESNAGININGNGAIGTIDATIADSTISDNHYGIMPSSGAIVTNVTILRSTINNNSIYGVWEQGPNSTTYLGGSSLSGNATAFFVANNGTLNSFGNNYIKGNGGDGGVIPLVAMK